MFSILNVLQPLTDYGYMRIVHLFFYGKHMLHLYLSAVII